MANMSWVADKVAYRNDESFFKAYKGNSLLWLKSVIFYTSTDNNVITPTETSAFGANIISNTYNNGIGQILFDDNITNIGDGAFYGLNRLKTIILPDTVRTIGSSVFNACQNLREIKFSSSLSTIGYMSLRYCNSLTVVDIPTSVTNILGYAFVFCEGLNSITLHSLPPNIAAGVFANTNNCPIYVPSRYLDNYLVDTNWSQYASRIQAIPEI